MSPRTPIRLLSAGGSTGVETPVREGKQAAGRGKFSRDKGARVEREVAKALHALTGITFIRNLEQVRADQLGDLTPDDAAWPFTLEVKARATGSACAPAWIAQAVKAANKAGTWPAVIYKFDRRDVRVHVPVAAIACAAGAGWADCEDWADITLEGLAYVARELMARSAHP